MDEPDASTHDLFGREAAGPVENAEATIKAKRGAVDRWVTSIFKRLTDPQLHYEEINRLFFAFVEVYPGVIFPPLIEKKALDLALAVYPQRQDLRGRLAEVERMLEERERQDMSETDPAAPLEELLRPPFGEDAAQRFFTCLPDSRSMAPFFDFVVRKVVARDHRSVFWGDRMLTLDKHAGFMSDPAFAMAWEEVRSAHPYDQYDTEQSIAWRLHTLVWAARQAMSLVTGDFVECGVFQGDMAYVVFHAAGLAGCGRRMRLFDSFHGFDPAQVAEGEYALMPGFLETANSYYQKPGLYESVLARFAPYPEVSVHRGYLPGILSGETPEAIAWLHIDLNSANAEVGTLEVLFERVMPGGLIILDDYGWAGYAMQKSAEDVFFANLGYQVLELPTGQGLVVKRP